MYSLFDKLKSLFTFEAVNRDEITFRLFYKVTCTMQICMVILLGAKQYFGDPIICDSSTNSVPRDVMNNYCWIHGTSTLEEYLRPAQTRSTVVQQGIGVQYNRRTYTRISHAWYQWVPLMLLLVAAAFYLPRLLWKYFEAGGIQQLVQFDKDNSLKTVENDDNAETKRVATLYRAFGRRLTFNKRYYFLYLVCLYANAFILVGVIYVVDRFFNGNFVDYGRDFLTFYLATPEVQKTMINPIDKVFPKMTGCDYDTFGVSGTMEMNGALCVLPLNILNEKIFFLLYLWYGFLALALGLNLLDKTLMHVWPFYRRVWMKFKFHVSPSKIVELDRNLRVSDWFVICQLEKNVAYNSFSTFIDALEAKFIWQKNPKGPIPKFEGMSMRANNEAYQPYRGQTREEETYQTESLTMKEEVFAVVRPEANGDPRSQYSEDNLEDEGKTSPKNIVARPKKESASKFVTLDMEDVDETKFGQKAKSVKGKFADTRDKIKKGYKEIRQP